MTTYIAIAGALTLLIVYGVLSDANGRDWSNRPGGPMAWGFLVFLFWPIFLPLYMLARPKKDTPPGWYKDVRNEAPFRYWDGVAWTDRTSSIKGDPPIENKVCPECAEEVKAAAVMCRFCGHRFDVVTT